MDALVTRNFTVAGQINSMFTPSGGSPTLKYIANLTVELWYKGPMETTFLGSGLTNEEGKYVIVFESESPSPMIVNGVISNVFVKVLYNNKVIIGDIDPSAGSFD